MQAAGALRGYVVKVLIVLALVALAALAWNLSGLLVVVFGAVVIGVLLEALASRVAARLRFAHGLALLVVLLILFAAVFLLMWLFGAQMAREMDSLKQTLPAAFSHFVAWLEGSALGPLAQQAVEQVKAGAGTIAARLGGIARSAGGYLTDVVLMLVGGIYLAAQPQLYRQGLLKLFPADTRPRMDQAFRDCGDALRAWLGGQVVAMLMVGLLTSLGLWLLGVPVAGGLGMIAGLFDIVPIVGPFVAAVPAVLLGFTVGPEVGLGAALVFIAVQQIESHVLLPLIQQRAVDIPPAVLLFSLIAIGTLFGVPGVLLAAPMTVVIFVLIKRLYVQDALDTPTSTPSDDSAGRSE